LYVGLFYANDLEKDLQHHRNVDFFLQNLTNNSLDICGHVIPFILSLDNQLS
jgi:hypothetical protein